MQKNINTMLQVEQAITALKAGLPVAVETSRAGKRITFFSAEAIKHVAGVTLQFPVDVVLARARAQVLFKKKFTGAVVVKASTQETLDNLVGLSLDLQWKPIKTLGITRAKAEWNAALSLLKIGELIPAAIIAKEPPTITISARAIQLFSETSAATLAPVCDAPLLLKDAPKARIVLFRSAVGTKEHSAIVVGAPNPRQAPLVRVHSSCFTGDVLGSLRCDCGEQLESALRAMTQAGGGILLYLQQEGRGIGLANKLRAYTLQAKGMDTVDANEFLGFDDDERPFLLAATMLKQLGYKTVSLMTNNPRKVKGLEKEGIKVAKRVDHKICGTSENSNYLKTKFSRLGHIS